MSEIRRNTPNRRNRSCWGRNRDTHPQRRSEQACRSGLWIKADGHGLLCTGFSCSLGSSLFLALWGSVRGFKWPYKTTEWLTLPQPHRKQAQSEVRWHSSPPKCHASGSEVGAEEDPEPLDVSSISISALPGGRKVQQCCRFGATNSKGFRSGKRANTAGLRQDRLMYRTANAAFCQNSRCRRTFSKDRTKWLGKPLVSPASCLCRRSDSASAQEPQWGTTAFGGSRTAGCTASSRIPHDSTAMHMLAAHQIVPSFPALETKQPQVVMSKASEGGGVMKKEGEQNFSSSQFIRKGKIKVT